MALIGITGTAITNTCLRFCVAADGGSNKISAQRLWLENIKLISSTTSLSSSSSSSTTTSQTTRIVTSQALPAALAPLRTDGYLLKPKDGAAGFVVWLSFQPALAHRR
jgi:hypothetical protein